MQNKKYSFLVVFAFISFLFFLYSPDYTAKIDDLISKVFYAIQKDQLDPSNLVVVKIDDKTLKEVNSKWPFDRSLYAKALKIIDKYNPKVIGIDIVFAGEGSKEKEDQVFASALEKNKSPVVLAYFLGKKGKPIYPQKELKLNATTAFINVPAGDDQIIRYARGYYKKNNFSDFSWTVKIASYFYNTTPQKELNKIAINKTEIPLEVNQIFLINYLLKPKDFHNISFYQIFSKDFSPKIFTGKIVLISPTLEIIHDIYSTPLGKMPGIYIHGNALFNIIHKKIVQNTPFILNFIFLLIALLAIGYFFITYTFLRYIILSTGVLLLLLWVDIGLRFNGFQLPYGKIAVSCFMFISLGAAYSYLNYLLAVAKIKNRAVVDPLTGLYNIRYFFERLSFDTKKIPRPKIYEVIVRIKGFKKALNDLSFSEIKSFWNELDSLLHSISKLWCSYSQETIIGKVTTIKKLDILKEKIKNLLSKYQIQINVQLGAIKLTPKLLQKAALSELINKIDQSEKEIILFNEKELTVSKHKKNKISDFLSSLYADTEEKNRELLLHIKKIKEEENKTKKAYLQLVASLISALESKDPYTEGHSNRVCKYALMLADQIDLSKEEKDKIEKAALLHDLGKIGISDYVLHKKGKLSETEFNIIKEHSTTSAKILKPIDEFKEIIPYILHHHESFDGSGYPHGLAGNFIPLGARILAVADIFDALITGRDYKKAFEPKKATAILKDMKNKKLDPKLVDSFIAALKKNRIID
ncbi:MAG: CHASE2 domain-containing protein [Candidatus Omnitrophica bacterium]|nr:CHASE2 domain-containing protein [Candidatus Omnitrophota bacterium]MCF7894053.1 CHASE2 domain-containing protein [Candidatus Omnitrophota bacterium]